jgi:uncharacterized protein with HEPN domain
MKEKRKKKTTLTDKEIFTYILGSLELIKDYLKNYTFEKYENEIMVQDAVINRMHCIEIAANDFSEELLNKYSDFPWFFYNMWTLLDNSEVIWDLVKVKHKTDDEFVSIDSYFSKLEELYFLEYYPPNNKYNNKKNRKETELSTNYKHPIKTSKSIWTVKK